LFAQLVDKAEMSGVGIEGRSKVTKSVIWRVGSFAFEDRKELEMKA
jgi:hypothetical protein